MNKYKVVLLLAAIIGVTSLQAQRKEWNLGVFANPSAQYRVKINGELQDPGFAFDVEPGRINLEIWSPQYEVFDTTFVYHSGKIVINKKLEPTEELQLYNKAVAEQSEIQTKVYLSVTGAVLLSGVAVGNSYALGDRKYRYRVEELGNKYDLAGHSQEDLDDARSALNNSRIIQYSLYAGIAALTYVGIKQIINMKNVDVPELKEDRSFYVDDVGFSPGPNGAVHGMLRIKF